MIIINPGSGPVADATEKHARTALKQFIRDLDIPKEWSVTHSGGVDERDGRWRYELVTSRGSEQYSVEVLMPGWPVERIRYVGDEGQNAFDFPRLYVDGSSWLWKYAMSSARRTLLGEDDGE